VARQMGHAVPSSDELDDLSFEKGRRRFFTDDELRRGRSNSNISCHHLKENIAKKNTFPSLVGRK